MNPARYISTLAAVCVGVGVTLFATAPASAQAVLHTWTGATDNRFWGVTGNWDPQFIPRSFDDVQFTGAAVANSGLRSFHGTTVHNMVVSNATSIGFMPEGTFNATRLIVGSAVAQMTTMSLLSFNGNTVYNAQDVSIGIFSNAPGLVFVENGTVLQANSNLLVGQSSNGSGTLVVRGGGRVTAHRTSVGDTAGSTGTVFVANAGTVFNGTGPLTNQIGRGGNATFDVAGGAVANMGNTQVGALAGSSGSVSVAGSGSRWNGSSLTLGIAAGTSDAQLEVETGGRVDLTGSLIVNTGATTDVTGSGSRLDVNFTATVIGGDLDVRQGGILAINNAGLASTSLRIAQGANATPGSVTAGTGGTITTARPVVGAGGTLNVAGGSVNASAITIEDGGTLAMSGGAIFAAIIDAQAVLPGQVNWTAGTITMTQPLVIGATGLFNDATTVPSAGSLVAGSITTETGATFNASGAVTANLVTNRGLANLSGSSNLGRIVNETGGTLQFGNAAIVELDNSGQVDFSGNDNRVSGSSILRAGSTINVDAGAVFNGLVSGGGNFTGAGLVTFNGGYDPGDSPASITFNGGVVFGSANTLRIEIGGLTAGVQYDQLSILGDATLDGDLLVELIDDFTPVYGDAFTILDLSGTRTGIFAGLGEGAIVSSTGGQEFFITYLGGDGNNVVLTAIPEPTTLSLLGLGAIALYRRRRA